MYGTVSAHAATIVALAVLSCGAIRRKWFTALMVVCTLVICYSRIYLGKHFPMDIVWGTLVGLGLGYAACGATSGWHRAGTDDSPTPAEAYLRRIY